MIIDGIGILSSIVYGPDQRTRISPTTNRVLFTTYAPAGIKRQMLEGHLNDLKIYTEFINPGAEVLEERIVQANDG
jgi:hypothetical protein